MQLQEKIQVAEISAPVTQSVVEQNILSKRFYTLEEYLALEETATFKSEYHDGKITPMTGGTFAHNQISLNLSLAFLALRPQGYQVCMADMRLWIPQKRRSVYPDVMLIAGKPEYYNNRRDVITNPQVIIEVLSKSTQAADFPGKFRLYRTIPTFQEYVLVDQYEHYVMQFHKNAEKQWSLSEYDEEQEVLNLRSIDCPIALKNIYEQVEFEAEIDAEQTESEDTVDEF